MKDLSVEEVGNVQADPNSGALGNKFYLSLPITPSEVKSPLRAVRKRPERAVPDIFLRVG
jgi:hypothetical protein